MPPLILLDLKTTGSSPDRHEIIQIAAVRLGGNGANAEFFVTYVRPQDSIPWHISVLTGIRSADLAKAPVAPAALRALARFIGVGCATGVGSAEPVIVAHDGQRFALRFITTACVRYGLPMRSVLYLDSVNLARALWPTEVRHNLDSVAGRLGIDVDASHYRDHDARADLRLLSAVVRRMAHKLSLIDTSGNIESRALPHDFVATV